MIGDPDLSIYVITMEEDVSNKNNNKSTGQIEFNNGDPTRNYDSGSRLAHRGGKMAETVLFGRKCLVLL